MVNEAHPGGLDSDEVDSGRLRRNRRGRSRGHLGGRPGPPGEGRDDRHHRIPRRDRGAGPASEPDPARLDASGVDRREAGAWLAPLVNAGVVLSVRSVEGDPVTALRQAADDLGATAIVVGGRRADPHRPLGVGSVTLRLLERSTSPVVLVPLPPG